MSDDTELKHLASSLAEIGCLMAGSLPMGLRVARRKAKEILPDGCAMTQEVAAHRLVALVMMTNALLMLENSTEPGKVEETIEDNIRFAKMLLSAGQGRETAEEDDDQPSAKWLSDEQLKQMFSKECES